MGFVVVEIAEWSGDARRVVNMKKAPCGCRRPLKVPYEEGLDLKEGNDLLFSAHDAGQDHGVAFNLCIK